MGLCPDESALGPMNTCVRDSWSAIVPFAVVVLLLFLSIRIPLSLPVHVVQFLSIPFRRFLTLNEAEDLQTSNQTSNAKDLNTQSTESIPIWRTFVFAVLGLIEALAWVAAGSYDLITVTEGWWSGIRAFMVAFVWLYTVVRAISRPTATPPYDLFTVYCIQLISAALKFGGPFYDNNVIGTPLPPSYVTVINVLNLAVVLGLVVVVLGMPLAIPSQSISKEDIGLTISPEDYTTLWGWVTFSWVYPLIRRGRDVTLNENDIWELSPTLQSRPVFLKFSEIQRNTLFKRLFVANALDLLLDFALTLVSVAFNYGNPYFLKRILDAIDRQEATDADRSRAYVYAFLMLVASLAKAEADVLHLWFGRRGCTRIRSSLMASIYDKALKRKDYSGIIDKEKLKQEAEKKVAEETNGKSSKKKTKEEKKREKEAKAKADDPRAGADTGKIVNLMAGDANRLAHIVSGAYFIYGAPFEILIGGTFLYQLMGLSAFSGFLVLLAGWPLNSYLAKRSIRINKGALAARDKRMGVLDELIKAVKFIKFFAWEDRWIQRALDAREAEIKWMIQARLNSIMFSALWVSAPILVSVISFAVYVWMGNVLTISTAFTAIALFNMIRAPLNVIPAWIVQILQAGVALNRISVYLQEDEVTDQVSSLKKETVDPDLTLEEDGFGLDRASFKWNEVEETTESATSPDHSRNASIDSIVSNEVVDHKFELRDISVLFPERQLSIVTGPTASGKTALLMAVLGEMTLLEGKIIMNKNTSRVDEFGLMHSISYAAQTPWLRHQSIKDNILFGYPLDEERYQAVLEACALKPDLEVLEDGDATEIGARGVSLSGGQKARVALARAVYARTKYVLLDDPLSAVDSHTSRVLYEKLLRGPLLANRTVVLVTHHVDLVLPGADYLVRMLDGRIDTQGSIKELRAQGVLDYIADDAAVEVHEQEAVQADTVVEGEPQEKQVKKPRKLIKDEHREEGSVKWNIYKTYLKASSYYIWAFLVFLVIVSQLVGLSEKVWIMIWGDAYKQGEDANANNWLFRSWYSDHESVLDMPYHVHSHPVHPQTVSKAGLLGIHWPNANERPLFYVGIYAAIGAASALVSISSAAAQYTGALRASRILFKQLLVTVVRATFRFHDTTPQGRMLNRFGKDVETIDSSLAGSLQAVNSSLASFFTSILTVTVVFPLFLIPASLLGFIYRELALGYLNTGRDLRRMESNSRSPIFSDFGELLEGIVTVRAFSAERRFLDNLHKKVDNTTKMWYTFWMTNRWLLFDFDTLGSFAVFLTAILSIYSVRNGAGIAGLCITSALSFTSSVYWACRFWTSLELDLNAVERVVEYLDLPQEPPAIIESNRPPAYWPSSSSDELIRAENLIVRYSPDLPAVLHDVSFTLRAGERVGLLGRTGSGKSTLAMSLLRFVDPTSGRILVDGIDISKIGLHDLRSRLTFIPQDATLFSGTLRDNLDPFHEHDDSECIDVLIRVHMITSLPPSQRTSRSQSAISSPSGSRPGSIHRDIYPTEESSDTVSTTASSVTEVDQKTSISLETQVSAGGANFSQGQRQLIALARALLRRSSIIILDEATSSIDFATDAKIQETIRQEFGGSLLVTVAHRLRTVIDYDRLIVLDNGRIAEFDTPWNLIQREDGIFRTMCLKSGSFAELEATAKTKASIM